MQQIGTAFFRLSYSKSEVDQHGLLEPILQNFLGPAMALPKNFSSKTVIFVQTFLKQQLPLYGPMVRSGKT